MICAQRTRARTGPSSAEARPLGPAGQHTGLSGRYSFRPATRQNAVPAARQRFGLAGPQCTGAAERMPSVLTRRQPAGAARPEGTGPVDHGPSVVARLHQSRPVGHQPPGPADVRFCGQLGPFEPRRFNQAKPAGQAPGVPWRRRFDPPAFDAAARPVAGRSCWSAHRQMRPTCPGRVSTARARPADRRDRRGRR